MYDLAVSRSCREIRRGEPIHDSILRALGAVALLILFVLAAFQGALGQSTSAPAPRVGSIPTAHVYHHLFRYVLHLESLRPNGEENPFMSDIAGRVFEMTPSQWALIQKEAHRCEVDVAPIDAQAQQLIANIKKQYPGGIVADASQLPKPPDALIALQQQRDAAIQRHVDNLQRALGTEVFGHLDSNLKERFARHIHGSTLPLATRSTSGPRKPQLLQGK